MSGRLISIHTYIYIFIYLKKNIYLNNVFISFFFLFSVSSGLVPRARPLGRIWRCKGVLEPFKSCSQRGVPLQVSIPPEIRVPEEATHLAASAENEVMKEITVEIQ